MADPLRVLVVGGTGVFGSRLVTGLLETTGFAVVIGGRNPPAGVPALRMDTRTVTADALRSSGAFAVVDAAGPYQGGNYWLARAAIAAGLHFIDLADARDHVAGFAALDGAARQAGVTALTGASSTPALSNAALDALARGWRQVDRVEIAISPGNRAPRGLAVMRSILSYAGQPVRVFDGGRWGTRAGWGMTVRRAIPGLGGRWLSLSETPDLDIVPRRFSVRQSAVFRAGLELPLLQFGLLAASLAVRARLLDSLVPLARPFRAMAAVVEPLGTDRGGMTVAAKGLDAEGIAVSAMWSLVAESGDGPFVPTLPVLAALRALAEGCLAPGASACVGVLPLAAIEAEFRGRRIRSRIDVTRSPSLYETVLGPAFAGLPQAVQRLHRPGWGMRANGVAQVDGAATFAGRLVAAAFRFPPAAQAVPVTIDIVPGADGERWTRDFGGRRFASVLSAHRRPGWINERFGPFRFALALPCGPAGIAGMPVQAWRLGPLPLPLAFAPVSTATEAVDEHGRFRFDVELRLPFGLGRLVRYRGWLVPQDTSEPLSRRTGEGEDQAVLSPPAPNAACAAARRATGTRYGLHDT